MTQCRPAFISSAVAHKKVQRGDKKSEAERGACGRRKRAGLLSWPDATLATVARCTLPMSGKPVLFLALLANTLSLSSIQAPAATIIDTIQGDTFCITCGLYGVYSSQSVHCDLHRRPIQRSPEWRRISPATDLSMLASWATPGANHRFTGAGRCSTSASRPLAPLT